MSSGPRSGGGGAGGRSRVGASTPGAGGTFNCTTLPRLFLDTLPPDAIPPHPAECDVMQRCYGINPGPNVTSFAVRRGPLRDT